MQSLRCAAFCALFAAAAFAQSDRGTITGTVSDPANAMVPNAKVVATNTATGAVTQTVTTGTGNYTIASLPVGSYDLAVEAPGFKKTTQPGLQVQVAQVLRADIVLQVGAATESVTVTAEAPIIKSENAEQSINVSGDRINNLPMNFGGGGGSTGNIRSWTSFAMLSPGTVGTAENNRINGAQSGSYKIIVEGQEVTSQNQVTWTSTVSQASVEQIEEFSLQTSNYAAEFGQVSGGLFNFTIKSGTNALHGSGYEYFANEALDAQRPFVFIRPLSRKHDFGGSLTGPIWIPKIYNGKNRTFFSFNYEAFRNHVRASASLQTVPIDAYRNGDFSQALTLRPGFSRGNDPQGRAIVDGTIYDLGTNTNVNGLIYRQPFPGNLIPKTSLDPVSLAIQKFIPEPNVPGSGLINNWIPDNSYNKNQDLPGIKIDHSINSKNKLSFYYSKQSTDQVTSPDGLPFPISAIRVQAIYGITTRLNYDYSITPTVLLHLGTGYLRFHNPDSSPAESLQYDAVGGIGFKGSVTSPSGFPRINLTNPSNGTGDGNYGGMSLAMGPSNANSYFDSKWSGVASLIYVRGNHTYKTGGEYQVNSWTDRNTRGAQGILTYRVDETGPSTSVNGISLAAGQSGLTYASFLLGAVNNASVNAIQDPQWRGYKAALYIQDDWRVNRKLTVNYGLRWDIQTQGHEIWYRNSMFGPSIVNPNAGGRPGGIVYEGFGAGRCNCNFENPYPFSIGPRLSAAYQINSKTVLRAGIGVIYGNLGQLSYLTNAQIQGVGINQQQFNNPGNGLPSLYARDGLVFNVGELYKPTFDPGLLVTSGGALNGGPAATEDPNGARAPRILQWNISLQRELTRDLALEAAYVANRGVWLTQTNLVNPNALTRDRLASFGLDPYNNAADRALLTGPLTSSAAISRGFSTPPYPGFLTSNTVAQSLRPFPQFNGNLAPRWSPLGNSWYDSLQMKLTKRFSHGLDGTVSFTWDKELSTSGISDLSNRSLNKSLSSGDIPYILVIGLNYEVPKVTQNKFLRQAIGGWTFGGLMVYQSGALIQVPNSNTVLNNYTFIGTNNTRKMRVPGEPLYLKDLNCGCIDPYKDLVLNPKAWVDVAEGTFSPASPYFNDYRQARRPSEQFSLGRRFSLAKWREGMSFQIRAEFFNAFNRLQLATPSSNNSDAGTTKDNQGRLTGGFGFINPVGTGNALPRNGQLVARFQW